MTRKKPITLRALREARGLTLQAVAMATGIPYSTVQAIESGRGAGFSLETKQRLAAFFGVPVASLFSEEKERAARIMGANQQLPIFNAANTQEAMSWTTPSASESVPQTKARQSAPQNKGRTGGMETK